MVGGIYLHLVEEGMRKGKLVTRRWKRRQLLACTSNPGEEDRGETNQYLVIEWLPGMRGWERERDLVTRISKIHKGGFLFDKFVQVGGRNT
jgi:hypothetical protein